MDEFDAVFMFEGERLNMSSRGYMKVHPALVVQTKSVL
jgi:hypothetical protein